MVSFYVWFEQTVFGHRFARQVFRTMHARSGKTLVSVERGEVYDVSRCRPSPAGEALSPATSHHAGGGGADQVLVLRRASGRVGLWLPSAHTSRQYPSLEEWFSGKLLHVPDKGGKGDKRSLRLAPRQLEALTEAFRFAGTREFKSMLQKIVRERPKMCWLLTKEDTLGVSTDSPHVPTSASHPHGIGVDKAAGGQCLPADLVLAYVVVRMASPSQPGQFMPDLGVFVPALVSLLKRLAVIAWEDSAPVPRELITLLSAAMIAREMPVWRPSVEFVARVVVMSVRMYACKRRCDYDVGRGSVVLAGGADALRPTHTLTTARTMIEVASTARQPVKEGERVAAVVAAVLLKDLRSFESDMAMATDIGHQWPKSVVTPKSVPRLEKIPFPDHGLDQHVFLGATAMAFLVPVWLRRKRKCSKWTKWPTKRAQALLAQLMTTGAKTGKQSTPYARVLSFVFSAVTGHNPRRTANILDSECEPSSDADTILLATRYAQQTLRLLFWRRAHDTKRDAGQCITDTKANSASSCSDRPEPPAVKRAKIERGSTASTSANEKALPSASANKDSVLEMKFKLPRAYLAALVGVLEIGKMPHAMRKGKGKKAPNPPMMVTLNPSNILDFVAIRKVRPLIVCRKTMRNVL